MRTYDSLPEAIEAYFDSARRLK